MAPPKPLEPGPDPARELSLLVAELAQNTDREAVVSEIEVLQSIYEDNVRLWHPPDGHRNGDPQTIRYEVSMTLLPPFDDVEVKILVTVLPTYPASSPPQLQLLSRYIGVYSVDVDLFGLVLRTYHSAAGVQWTENSVCVFDGLQNALELCTSWYDERMRSQKVKEMGRADAMDGTPSSVITGAEGAHANAEETTPDTPTGPASLALPEGIVMYTAEPIVDRKSAFVGRACSISHPSQVPLVLSYLASDRRISRAAHPVINAWRCRVDNLLHQDNDDDGETAAGGRLAHLLQILELHNVLVIVTRYFGGIHLGPDRFKHINQAARNALELGGFLDVPDTKRKASLTKKH